MRLTQQLSPAVPTVKMLPFVIWIFKPHPPYIVRRIRYNAKYFLLLPKLGFLQHTRRHLFSFYSLWYFLRIQIHWYFLLSWYEFFLPIDMSNVFLYTHTQQLEHCHTNVQCGTAGHCHSWDTKTQFETLK